MHLRFAAVTEDPPLRVHEFSDRVLVVSSGLGLFHYVPNARNSRKLRSVAVEAGEAVLFTRIAMHSFTAPFEDVALLSYHAPFFGLGDVRQFTVPKSSGESRIVGMANRMARIANPARILPLRLLGCLPYNHGVSR